VRSIAAVFVGQRRLARAAGAILFGMAIALSATASLAPDSHQKRHRRTATNAIESERKVNEINEPKCPHFGRYRGQSRCCEFTGFLSVVEPEPAEWRPLER